MSEDELHKLVSMNIKEQKIRDHPSELTVSLLGLKDGIGSH